MPKRNLDHVVMHDGSKGFWGFECRHCLQRQGLPESVAIPMLVAMGNAFGDMHERCPAPKDARGDLRREQLAGAFERAHERYERECLMHNAPLETRVLLECFEDELQRLGAPNTVPEAVNPRPGAFDL